MASSRQENNCDHKVLMPQGADATSLRCGLMRYVFGNRAGTRVVKTAIREQVSFCAEPFRHGDHGWTAFRYSCS